MILHTPWFLSTLIGLVIAQGPPPKVLASDGDFNNVNTDGSYDFGYDNKDRGGSYHISQANRNNVVRGRFGSRDPSDGKVKETLYTAGPRGFRARGPHVHRRMDLDQRSRGPIGNKDDPYFDPNEDPSFSYGFKTSTYEKQEDQNRRGDVTGRYSFVDDIGERHNVEYIAGRDTGFHVKTAYPDSNPGSIGPLFYNGPLVRGEKKQRGHTSIQRGLDGSYRFISAGPDQRRTESSDSSGNVRGSYTFLDDKNIQRTVHYIAGPGIGYRVIKNSKDPFIPSFIPGLPDYRDPALNKPFPSVDPFVPETPFIDKDDSLDDIFGRPGGSAASGHVKPPPNKPPIISSGEKDNDIFDKGDESIFGTSQEKPNIRPISAERPGSSSQERPSFGSSGPKPGKRPGSSGSSGPPFGSGERPGSYPGGGGDDDDDFFGKPNVIPDSKPPSSGSSGPPDFPNLDNIKPDTDDDDIFGGSRPPRPGSRPGSGGSSSRPGGGGGPESSERPTRPGSFETNERPDPGFRPFERPGTGYRPSSRPSSRPGSRPRPGRPTSRPDSSENLKPKPDFDEDDDLFGGPKPGSSGSGEKHDGGYPSGKPGGYRPSSRPGGYRPSRPGGGFRPTRPTSGSRPGSNRPQSNEIDKDKDSSEKFKPGEAGVSFVNVDEDDDLFGGPPGSGSSNKKPGSSHESGFQSGGGSYGGSSKPSRPGSTLTGPSSSGSSASGSEKPLGPPISGGFPGDKDDSNKHNGVYPHPGGDTEIKFGGPVEGNTGGTIFTNLGAESIHFPPGKSVRAHVQSIDLIPYGTKVPSPAEAIDNELKKHGSR